MFENLEKFVTLKLNNCQLTGKDRLQAGNTSIADMTLLKVRGMEKLLECNVVMFNARSLELGSCKVITG